MARGRHFTHEDYGLYIRPDKISVRICYLDANDSRKAYHRQYSPKAGESISEALVAARAIRDDLLTKPEVRRYLESVYVDPTGVVATCSRVRHGAKDKLCEGLLGVSAKVSRMKLADGKIAQYLVIVGLNRPSGSTGPKYKNGVFKKISPIERDNDQIYSRR